VRELTASALSIYPLDRALLAELAPDVIVTQDLCAVCAVPRSEVVRAVSELGLVHTQIVALSPLTLADVWTDVERVGTALGRAENGRALARELRARCDALAARTPAHAARPSVLTIEWLDPVMIGGTWMPELVALAGGTALGARAGERAPVCTLAELGAFEPDVVLVKPCGFELARTRGESALVARVIGALGGSAAERGAVFLADGSAFFNRPGPRLVESLEILAACLAPERFADWAARHAAAFEPWRAR
jgi:iron complex transport system substrate-binding protein